LILTGQPKLPIALKFAGLGTYQCPWFVDTNDLLLQAIPNADETSFFIDEAWISFVVDFNKYLRLMQREFLEYDIVRLLQFLQDPTTSTSLGGLTFDICTFTNIETIYKSDLLLKEKSNKDFSVVINFNRKNEDESNIDIDNFSHRESMDVALTKLDFAHILSHNLTDKSKEKDFNDRIDESEFAQESNDSRKSDLDEDKDRDFKKEYTCSETSYERAVHILKIMNDNMIKLSSIIYPSSHFNEEDPNGFNFTFKEMCSAILEGKLSLGVRISHPKVDNFNYQFKDKDVNCDSIEESFLTKKRNSIINNPTNQNNYTFNKEINNVKNDYDYDSDEIEQKRQISNSANEMAEKNYGIKSKEMSKFYGIMMEAEANLVSSSPSISGSVDELFKPSSSLTSSASVTEQVVSEDNIKKLPFVKGFHHSSLQQLTSLESLGNNTKVYNDNDQLSSLSNMLSNDISKDNSDSDSNDSDKKESSRKSKICCSNFIHSKELLEKIKSEVNLAPSGYQHEINIWKLDESESTAISSNSTIKSINKIENKNIIPNFDIADSGSNSKSNFYNLVKHLRILFRFTLILRTSVYNPLRRVIFGANVHRVGRKWARYLLGFYLFISQFVDLILLVLFSFLVTFTDSESSQSSNTDWLILIYLLPPLAVIIPPFTGMYCLLFDNMSTVLLRIYANWSRLALIPTISVVFFSIFAKVTEKSPYFWQLTSILIASRIGQNFLVDHYIAHVESMRLTRGWDGLYTSLYPSRFMIFILNYYYFLTFYYFIIL
jgi:hypothetical protein